MTAKYEILKLWLKYISRLHFRGRPSREGENTDDPGILSLVNSLLIISSPVYLAWKYRDYYRQLFMARTAL